MEVTGPVPVNAPTVTIPVETLIESQKSGTALTDVKGTSAPTPQPLLFSPTIVAPPGASGAAPAAAPAPAPAAAPAK
jgi:hypothetical protein